MTEEIIIDGVNVAGCCNLNEWKHCNICQELIKTIPNRHQCLIEEDLRCEFYPNCYYKQLQRLEQERDELKKTVENQKLEYEELQCDYNELEQRHNDAFEQFKEMQARHDELLASCEQSEQEAAEIIDELKQENKELGRKAFLAEQNVRTTAATFCEKDNKIKELKQENKELKSALEEIKRTVMDIIEDNGRHNLSDFSSPIRIEKIINEVLK